jgi:hypothetical protein
MKYLKWILFSIFIPVAIFGIVSLILLILGYRPIIDPLSYPDWDAIGAIGQCIGAIAAIIIPIVVVYLSNHIRENINTIGNKTISTIKRISLQNFTPTSQYYSSATNGIITFDYSNNNGRYCIGQNEYIFEIMFSKASDKSIYVYNDPPSISTIALVKDISRLELINNANNYDTLSRARCPSINQIVILQNINDFYAAIKILEIKDDTRGALNDEVKFEYIIQTNNSPSFSNI